MKCKGTAKSTGKPCQLDAMRGSMVCHKHGGSAPQVRAAAKRRLLNAQVSNQLARLDVTPVSDPLTELGSLAGQVVAFKDQLATLVNQLHGDPVTCVECGHETTPFGTELRYTDVKGAEQLRSEVALWERALDRCASVLSSMARLKIDERLARITERQAEMFMSAMNAGLLAVDVPRERHIDAKRAAARHLRVAEGA